MADPSRSAIQHALQLAALAPSAHNTQPWKVTVSGKRVMLVADPERFLAHTDPTSRDLHLGLGGFAEAFQIGLASAGLEARPADPEPGAWASFDLHSAGASRQEEASLLRRRQTSRLAYSPRPLPAEVLTALGDAATRQGLELHLAPRGSAEHGELRLLLLAASRESWLDERAVHELQRWVHADFEGLRQAEDGLSTHCLGLGLPEAAALMALLRPGLWRGLKQIYAAQLVAERLAGEDVRAADRAAAFGVLIAPRVDSPAGAGVLRFWLEATRLGVALHPQSVLLDRRGWEVGKHLGVDPRRLKLALRLGRSVPPPRSGRRRVEQFAAFHS